MLKIFFFQKMKLPEVTSFEEDVNLISSKFVDERSLHKLNRTLIVQKYIIFNFLQIV